MTDDARQPPPVFFLTTPLEIVVEAQGKQVRGELSSRQPTAGVVSANLAPERGALLLCHLYADGWRTPALSVEGLVIGSAAADIDATEPSGYVLRWNWAYCPEGEEKLRQHVIRLLAYPEDRLTAKTIDTVETGAIFAFRPQERDRLAWLARRLQRRPLPSGGNSPDAGRSPQQIAPLERLRGYERVRVSVPCCFGASGSLTGEARGQIYNLGREGVFLSTRARVPDEGEKISIRVVMKHEGRKRPIKIVGTVRWPMELSDTPQGGGFGVEVCSIADGDNGRLFHAFLDHLVERHVEGAPPFPATSRLAQTRPVGPGSAHQMATPGSSRAPGTVLRVEQNPPFSGGSPGRSRRIDDGPTYQVATPRSNAALRMLDRLRQG